MSSKLEDKLLQYEKSTPISNDEALIKAINCIIVDEESLPYEERDFDLIDEAIEVILSIKKVDIEQLNECAVAVTDMYFDKIEFDSIQSVKKSNTKSVKIKWLIPIVAIISLLLIGSIVAYAFGFNVIDMARDAFAQLEEKVLYKDGDHDVIITNDYQEYESLEELVAAGNYSDLLLPYNLSNNYEITRIYAEDYGTYSAISIFIEGEGSEFELHITSPTSADYSSANTINICGFDIYYCEYDGISQGEFVYGNAYYSIISSSYDNLVNIINSLEENKYD